MRLLPVFVLLLAPAVALAAQPCQYQSPRHLQLDLAGVEAVQIAVHSHDLHLNGTAAAGLTLDGRACASSQAVLDSLQVTQRREGNQLILELGGDARSGFNLFGNAYANLEVTVKLPADMPVTLDVGSGDADAKELRQLRARVGSGDLHVSRVSGKFDASVGSGDIDASDIGSLNLGSVGSGDFKANAIKGDARVGSIGSGDVVLRHVGGSVRVDTLGSGDLTVNDVGGDFTLGAKGSGDVEHTGVKGEVSVPND